MTSVIRLTTRDNVGLTCPVSLRVEHQTKWRPRQKQQLQALSQNPQTYQSGMGTEIWDITGDSIIVVEPYEHVDKLLNPPQDDGFLDPSQLTAIMREQYGLNPAEMGGNPASKPSEPTGGTYTLKDGQQEQAFTHDHQPVPPEATRESEKRAPHKAPGTKAPETAGAKTTP